MALLELEDLRTGYEGTPVLHGVTLSVNEGETAVVLGLNGAGKTTTMLTIAGILKPWSGRLVFDGRRIAKKDTVALVKLGIVLVPEGRHVFPGLSVMNNLRMGAWSVRRDHRFVKERLAQVFEYFPILEERQGQLAGTLSGGEQQMLALGRGLMARPRLLLIDEASLGLSPKLVQQVFRIVQRINEDGVTVLMVEQNAGSVRGADRAFIMEKGRIIHEGAGSEMLEQGELRRAYLGTPA
ncbi:MAG TPA: ABC transporter ATP-binding protein [Actinomycetota bacterium]|nr:ABC transporter ATP-binding protein [Actinomycetota bacterium]